MSSDVAVIGLTFRGTDVQDLDSIFLEIVHGLFEPPSVRGTDLVVPASAGRSVRNRVADKLSIELAGFVRGVGGSTEADDRVDFAANRSVFRALFDPTLDPGELVATLEDSSQLSIYARTVDGILVDQQLPTYAKVSVPLESVDPDWVAVGSS